MLVFPTEPAPVFRYGEESFGESTIRLKSVSESLVVLQSLKQSRNRWLTSIFPKFSSKGRGGKPPEVQPPPHIIRSHGKFDLQVGPHMFKNTAVFEVQYIPDQPQYPPQSSCSPAPPQRASTPLITSLASGVSVTPSLVSHVNSAAATSPILANLVHLAAAGRASPDQLRTLGLLIQSMATTTSLSPYSDAPTIHSQATGLTMAPLTPDNVSVSWPPDESDLVLEFSEAPSERFIFPRRPVVCSQNGPDRISIRACVPFTSLGRRDFHYTGNITSTADAPPHVITFQLTRATSDLWNFVQKWSGGERTMAESGRVLDRVQAPQRVYLQHRLSDGAVLEQLRNAVAPQPTMKSIAPAHALENLKPKRKPAIRKSSDLGEASSASSSSANIGAPAPPSKKRRTSQSSKSDSPTERPRIACNACGQTGIPLLMGGRFCRQCVEAGRASSQIPGSDNEPKMFSFTLDLDNSSQLNPKINGQRKLKRRPSGMGMAAPPLLISSPLATHPPYSPSTYTPTGQNQPN